MNILPRSSVCVEHLQHPFQRVGPARPGAPVTMLHLRNLCQRQDSRSAAIPCGASILSNLLQCRHEPAASKGFWRHLKLPHFRKEQLPHIRGGVAKASYQIVIAAKSEDSVSEHLLYLLTVAALANKRPHELAVGTRTIITLEHGLTEFGKDCVLLQHAGCELQHLPPPSRMQRFEVLHKLRDIMLAESHSAPGCEILLQCQVAEAIGLVIDPREQSHESVVKQERAGHSEQRHTMAPTLLELLRACGQLEVTFLSQHLTHKRAHLQILNSQVQRRVHASRRASGVDAVLPLPQDTNGIVQPHSILKIHVCRRLLHLLLHERDRAL